MKLIRKPCSTLGQLRGAAGLAKLKRRRQAWPMLPGRNQCRMPAEAFQTYETASRENRLAPLARAYARWSSTVPGGAERFLCVAMAALLCLLVAIVHLTLRVNPAAAALDWVPGCARRRSSFECYCMLLIGAWLTAILAALVLALGHFVLWWCRTTTGHHHHHRRYHHHNK